MTDQTAVPTPTAHPDAALFPGTPREVIETYIDRASYASTMSERATLLAVAAGAGLAVATGAELDDTAAIVLNQPASSGPLHIVGTVEGDLR